MSHDLDDRSRLLRAQWDRLDSWLRALAPDLDDYADRPSALPEWTIGELISHLGRCMEALAVCGPVPAGTVPLTYAEYLGTYPQRAAEITAVTRELDAEIAADRLAGIEASAARAFARLNELTGQTVVQARRAPITLADMVSSRLVELVVHADDLARSLPGVVADPMDPAALAVVADDLLRIVAAREGCILQVTDPRAWMRLAAGRDRYDVVRLAAAVTTPHPSDGVPDLGRSLPVL
jgi:uncharacterized protein (TIGR03083 family)